MYHPPPSSPPSAYPPPLPSRPPQHPAPPSARGSTYLLSGSTAPAVVGHRKPSYAPRPPPRHHPPQQQQQFAQQAQATEPAVCNCCANTVRYPRGANSFRCMICGVVCDLKRRPGLAGAWEAGRSGAFAELQRLMSLLTPTSYRCTYTETLRHLHRIGCTRPCSQAALELVRQRRARGRPCFGLLLPRLRDEHFNGTRTASPRHHHHHILLPRLRRIVVSTLAAASFSAHHDRNTIKPAITELQYSHDVL